jgi:IclR family pca regulon transcriptional regulator
MLEGDEVVCIASTSFRGATSAEIQVDTRLPAYCTSMGRMFLAYLSPVCLEAYLARVVLNQLTPRTVRTVEGLRMILNILDGVAMPPAIRSTPINFALWHIPSDAGN